MPRRANAADLALSAALAERQINASPRKLETMRQAGMLEQRPRSGLGRGLGSRAFRADDEIDRAEYMARLLDDCGSYASAVLTAFVQDRYPIAKDRLDRGYERSIGQSLAAIDRNGGSSALDAALTAAGKVARYLTKQRAFRPLRQRARHLGLVHRNAPMHRVMYDLATDLIVLMVLRDENPTLRRLRMSAAEKLEMMTGDGTIEDPAPDPPPASPDALRFTELARRLHLAALPRLVRSATMQELVVARDAVKTFRAFAQVFGPFAQRRAGTGRAFPWLVVGMANDRTVAWSIPGLVLLRRIRGAELDATISFLAEWTPFFRSAEMFLHELPPHIQLIVRPNGYGSLTLGEQQELSEHVTRLETSHPHVLQTLRNPPEIRQVWDNS
jgi:hypothetical protein